MITRNHFAVVCADEECWWRVLIYAGLSHFELLADLTPFGFVQLYV